MPSYFTSLMLYFLTFNEYYKRMFSKREQSISKIKCIFRGSVDGFLKKNFLHLKFKKKNKYHFRRFSTRSTLRARLWTFVKVSYFNPALKKGHGYSTALQDVVQMAGQRLGRPPNGLPGIPSTHHLSPPEPAKIKK